MNPSFLCFLLLGGLTHAMPPVVFRTQAALQKVDPDIKPDHYEIARTDLNGDGKEDVLALMNGKSGYRGSGGATMFVLKGKDEGFESLGSVKVVNEPVYLRKSSTKGFRDLLVTVRGGGASQGIAELRFDGSQYPAAPEDPTAKVEDGDTVLFAEPSVPFEQSATLLGITFKVTCLNATSPNLVTIIPAGLEEDNRPIIEQTSGTVSGMEVADINADSSPEIYIYTTDAGKRAGLLAYSANRKKSLSQIFLPELGEHAKGYRGGDEFAVVEGILGRRFPIYPDDKPESGPTGKTRQIQYKLHAGEAGWILKPDQVVEF